MSERSYRELATHAIAVTIDYAAAELARARQGAADCAEELRSVMQENDSLRNQLAALEHQLYLATHPPDSPPTDRQAGQAAEGSGE